MSKNVFLVWDVFTRKTSNLTKQDVSINSTNVGTYSKIFIVFLCQRASVIFFSEKVSYKKILVLIFSNFSPFSEILVDIDDGQNFEKK